MAKFTKTIQINRPIHEVWAAIISDQKYRTWTAVFHAGSHFIGTWLPGTELIFSDGTNGMISELTRCDYPQTIELVTRGLLVNNQPDYDSTEALPWINTIERYDLTIISEAVTQFQVEMELHADFLAEFEQLWTKGLEALKTVCETDSARYDSITISTTIKAPLRDVWQALVEPTAIQQWNFADPSWYCPTAESQLTVGGRFCYTMAARDESFRFDLTGLFTTITPETQLEYLLDDGRFVSVSLTPEGDSITLVQTFEAETQNSLALQEQGWQAILNNFTAFVESQ